MEIKYVYGHLHYEQPRAIEFEVLYAYTSFGVAVNLIGWVKSELRGGKHFSLRIQELRSH